MVSTRVGRFLPCKFSSSLELIVVVVVAFFFMGKSPKKSKKGRCSDEKETSPEKRVSKKKIAGDKAMGCSGDKPTTRRSGSNGGALSVGALVWLLIGQ